MGQRVTLEDIAEASNTSVASVSLALRNKPGVSRVRRERILAAARSLGYARETPIASESENGTRHVGILFRSGTDSPGGPLLDRFNSWVLTGIQEAAEDADIHLVLGSLRLDMDGGAMTLPPESYFRSAADGLLLIGSYPSSVINCLLGITSPLGLPTISVDGSFARSMLDCVGTMNREGGHAATSYLIAQGHTRIAFAGSIGRNVPSFDERYLGYRDAMTEYGLEPQDLLVNEDEETVWRFDPENLSFTAVVAGNDHQATVLMRDLQGQGVSIPDEVSVVGFDDTDHALTSSPQLTTMRVDTLTMGRLAVDTLQFRWKWPDAAPFRTTLVPELVERCSVRRLHQER